jgi:hypothetical protein
MMMASSTMRVISDTIHSKAACKAPALLLGSLLLRALLLLGFGSRPQPLLLCLLSRLVSLLLCCCLGGRGRGGVLLLQALLLLLRPLCRCRLLLQ